MRISNIKFRSLFAASLFSVGSFSSAYGAGFAVIEVNATGQGNAYAGAAAHTNNASTIFFNPAGLMNIEGEQLVFAAHYIDPSSDFDNDGSALAPVFAPAPLTGTDDDGGESAFVPNFYWVKPIDENMSFGLGLNSPFGLKTEYEDEWRGRYHALLSDLKTVNVNPSIGYRVSDRVTVGAGVSLMLAKVDLTSAVDMGGLCFGLPGPLGAAAAAACGLAGVTPGTPSNDGKAELDGDNFDDFSLGYNFGIQFDVSSQTRVGVAYRSKIDVDVDGDADFSLPAATDLASATVGGVIGATGLFVDTGLGAKVTLPASFSVSVAHTVDKFTWLADATWTGWSVFDELRIEYDNPAQPDSVTTEDWDDSWRYSVGFDYQYSDALILRAGLAIDETPVPSSERRTPRIPGDERFWMSIGLTYVASNTFSFDVGYSRLTVDDPEIDNTFESAIPTLNHTLTGEYEADVDIFSAQLNWTLE
jgi:long-chain fatty acid transport protein